MPPAVPRCLGGYVNHRRWEPPQAAGGRAARDTRGGGGGGQRGANDRTGDDAEDAQHQPPAGANIRKNADTTRHGTAGQGRGKYNKT